MVSKRLLPLVLAVLGGAFVSLPYAGIGEIAGHLGYVMLPNMTQQQRWGIINIMDNASYNQTIAWQINPAIDWSENYTSPPAMSVTQMNGTLEPNVTVYVGVTANTAGVAPGNYTGMIGAFTNPIASVNGGAAIRPGTYKRFSILVLMPPTTTSTSVSTTTSVNTATATPAAPVPISSGEWAGFGIIVVLAVCCGIAAVKYGRKQKKPEQSKVA